MKEVRTYNQEKRAKSTSRTRQRLLAEAIEMFSQRPYSETSLHDIAGAAGTTAQTLLRHFGSKESLFEAAFEAAVEQVREQRNSAPVGDLSAAVLNLSEHYEEWGPRVLNMLACELTSPEIARITNEGRKLHEEWVERTFSPQLARVEANQQLLDVLIALTDVYFWQIVRHGRGRTAQEYRSALRFSVEAVIAASS